ncbi:MAG: response regulator [Candidatus Latescibacteria bacterium]|nr:response regulator [Candidatus Latescibacterota bacterium]
MNKRPTILLVDDVPANLNVLCAALEAASYNILMAKNGGDGLRIAASARPDLILLDVLMPDMDGYQVCRRLKEAEATRDIPVLFITAQNEKERLVEGFQVGGVDYITKPFADAEVLARVGAHLEINHLHRALAAKNDELTAINARLQEEIDGRRRADAHLDALALHESDRWDIDGFIGRSPTIGQILEEVRQLQGADSTSVLITGESGTGKELIARAIHSGGTRADKPFVPVNCGALPEGLVESVLFGHHKGAFTGAERHQDGVFVAADGGTLFLDEISDMPLEAQVKLLRVLEERCVRPLGATHERAVDVRVIAATNADLAGRISAGRFRGDLFYRLARFQVDVPPLRRRPEDIPLLTEHFLQLFAQEMRRPMPTLSAAALTSLRQYDFPGNVRELKNMMEYALIKSDGLIVEPDHLHFAGVPAAATDEIPASATPPAGDSEAPLSPDEDQILDHLTRHGRINNADCRDLLGINRRRATYLLDKLQARGRLQRLGANKHIYYIAHQYR